MKVVFLEAVQTFGGARKSTLELANRLSKSHDVLIVDFFGTCVPFIEYLNSNNLNFKVLDPVSDAIVLKSSRNIFSVVNNYIRFFPKWLQYRRKIKTILEDYGADFIIVNNKKTLSILQKSNKYKVVFFARGWYTPQQLSFISRLLFKRLSNIFVAVSEATRHAIYCSGLASLDNIYVLHNGIDVSNLPTESAQIESSSPDDLVILHCGGFLRSKGQHVSIEVAKVLKKNGIPFKMLLIGIIYKGAESSKYHSKILKQIQDDKLEKYVEIILNKPNVLEYFNACDIVIHPSATEGLPRVIMEAMALRKPVIANAVGGVTDYILDDFTGFITNYNDVNDYVNAIIKLYNSKDLYDEISNNALNLVKASFSESKQVERFEMILNSNN